MKRRSDPDKNGVSGRGSASRPDLRADRGKKAGAGLKKSGKEAAAGNERRRSKARQSRPQRPEQTEQPNTYKKPVSAQRLMAIERRKARSRAIGLSIFVLFIMLVTMLLIINVMQQTKPRPRFLFLTEGQVDHAVSATGLVMRDEMVFSSPADGLFKPLAAEGSRSARDQKVAMIIPQGYEEQLRELQKTEKDLVDLQIELMNSGKGAGARAIYDESAASIEPVINLIRSDASKGDLSNLTGYAATLSVILEQRTTKLMSIDFRDARIEELNKRRNQLELSLGLESGTLICEQPGIISYRMDGLEQSLNNAMAETITPELYVQVSQRSEPMSPAGDYVVKDQPVLRITSSLSQTLVFLLPETDPRTLSEENLYDIRIPSEGLLLREARLLRAEVYGDDTFAVFETDRLVERLSDRRLIDAQITVASTSGLKIPLSALTQIDPHRHEATLTAVSGGYTHAVRVAILDQDREFGIIEGLPGEAITLDVSTVIVLNPESIEVGEFIGSQ